MIGWLFVQLVFHLFEIPDLRIGVLSQIEARYRRALLCTLLYAGFVYQPSVQRQILHVDVKYSTVLTSKSGF